jgi:hypothetical protein
LFILHDISSKSNILCFLSVTKYCLLERIENSHVLKIEILDHISYK